MTAISPAVVPGGPELLIVLFILLVVFVIPALLLGVVLLIVRRRQRRIDELEARVDGLEGESAEPPANQRD